MVCEISSGICSKIIIIIENIFENYRNTNWVDTFPAPPPFSPTDIALSSKNGDEIIRRESAHNRTAAMLNG